MPPNNALIRASGLDTLRAVAIALVLMSHYDGFVSGKDTFGVVGKVGWTGVDLFFVLSGYLIGNQILSAIARKEAFSLKAFFARRLLRTLPNYYFMLALYFLLPHLLSGSSTAPLWRFLTFTQNIGLAYGQTFSHSWSLCIEEQFYLALPLVVLAVVRCRRPLAIGWCLIGAAIGAGMLARGSAFVLHEYDAFSAQTYYATWCRFDELLPGVAIALLKNFHGALYEKILAKGNVLLVAGLAAVVATLYCVKQELPDTLISTTLGFSLLAIGYGVLVMAALSPASLLGRIRVPGATQLALWSYAIYLVHKPIFMVAAPRLREMKVDVNAPLTVLLLFAASIFAGWLLFRCVETPFMQLRARWYPSRRAAPQLAPAA
ncbi:acyltransferase [Massilia sp. P8910]|uniref:acyltransferase family protein n=1 Tax=Massilia antarctica TaxID=2765360 RepID=UPI0006BB618F|nr:MULTISPECIES: acyltransferase [Massilia]MCE3606111.1 acyltransferase [Massilia antarctica]MCY0913198.1 acyltransferase [Massilia sp. H27-R4]CUI07801.1 Acyltransferase [Janthinobacterium sp. CG23_2]CUU31587.1 Acyltransferase [Janthinobacterium sp. CG23_2]